MRFWLRYRSFQLIPLIPAWRIVSLDFNSRAEFEAQLGLDEKEVPEACIKKLYPEVDWSNGHSRPWKGK